MADAFENIFSALRKSEKIAQSKRRQSKEVKEAIENLKETINFQQVSVQENLTKKNDLELSLAETTIELKLLQVTEKGFELDLEEIQKETQEEENRYHELLSGLTSLCEENSEKSTLFSKEYGVTSMGREMRQALAQEKSSLLKNEAETLNSEVLKLTKHITTLKASLDCKSQLMMEVNDLEKSIASEDENHRSQTSILIALQERNKALTDEPENGVEFVNNAKREQEHDLEELQSKARDYQTELKALTDQLKRREGQALQSQYRYWQKQKVQQSEASVDDVCGVPEESKDPLESTHADMDNESSLTNTNMTEEEIESSDFIMISSFEDIGK